MTPLLALLLACADPDPAPGLSLSVVSFNTGTSDGLGHDDPPEDGYGSAEAAISDAWYGNGLAWEPVIADAAAYFDATRPDLAAFQEIFWTGDCPSIPPEDRIGWACEGWSEGDPTVVERVLGPDYQVACHQGKPDKCLAVRLDVGHFAGCEGALCLDHLDGAPIEGCGSGSRVGRGVVELAGGGALTVVGVHGSSGLGPEEMDCRAAQFAQVFVDLDGEPAASGRRNLVLGDFNTDPGRYADFDRSAAALNDLAQAAGFHFLTDLGPEAVPTYAGLFNIDHVLSDRFEGDCDDGTVVSDIRYFDHLPIRCTLREGGR